MIIKVLVRVISLSLPLQLITLTPTLIILDIRETSSFRQHLQWIFDSYASEKKNGTKSYAWMLSVLEISINTSHCNVVFNFVQLSVVQCTCNCWTIIIIVNNLNAALSFRGLRTQISFNPQRQTVL